MPEHRGAEPTPAGRVTRRSAQKAKRTGQAVSIPAVQDVPSQSVHFGVLQQCKLGSVWTARFLSLTLSGAAAVIS